MSSPRSLRNHRHHHGAFGVRQPAMTLATYLCRVPILRLSLRGSWGNLNSELTKRGVSNEIKQEAHPRILFRTKEFDFLPSITYCDNYAAGPYLVPLSTFPCLLTSSKIGILRAPTATTHVNTPPIVINNFKSSHIEYYI